MNQLDPTNHSESAHSTAYHFARVASNYRNATLKAVLFAVLLAASTMAGAIPLPGTPVPITLQTLALTLGALMLTWRQAMSSVLIYLAIGAVGLPVFAGGKTGIVTFVGPSVGFLVGFVFGVIVIALIRDFADVALNVLMPEEGFAKIAVRFLSYMVASIIGTLVIYAFGFVGQSIVTSVDIPTIATASLGFVGGDLIKAIIASAIASGFYEALKKHQANR